MKKEFLIGPIFLILFWYLIYYLKIVNELFLPPPHVVFIKLFELFTYKLFWLDMLSTLWRTLLGFLIAGIIGIPLGLFMGSYRKVYDACEIIVDFFRSLPALAIFPLLMFFFGIGNTAKVATAIFSCIFINIINAMYGVKNSTKNRQISAYLMGANKWEIFRKVILMDALPQVFIGFRTSLSLALIVIVVTEMFIGTNFGIGYRIFESQQTYRVSEMYSFIIMAGLLGYGLNKGFIFFENQIIHWRGK